MKVLVIDDHALIRDALRGVLKELRDDAVIVEASECRQAMRLINEHPDIDLILLDLNLPKYDGRQLLEQIKNDDDLCHIPVVVLTTSAAEEDILKSYKLHANAYVTKPVDLDQFMSAVRQIDEFFVQVVKLPKQ